VASALQSRERMLTALLYLALASPPPAAPAPLCIRFDPAADKLSAGDRKTALALIEQAVAATGGQMAADGCSDPLALSHVKVGDAISVALRGPGGAHFAQAARMEALPEVYVRLFAQAKSENKSANRNANPAGSTAAPVAQVERDEPERPSRFGFGDGHGQFYARLGYNGTARDGMRTGPSLGLGYRRELGNLMFDVSTLNMNFWRQTQYDSYNDTWNAYLRLMAFRYLGDVLHGADLFAGGGLSYGESRTADGLRGAGIQGEVGLGYELLRHTVMRSFVQVVATIPFYEVFRDDYGNTYDTATGMSLPPTRITGYAFSVAASIGVGF
jgi:hypothetical protein